MHFLEWKCSNSIKISFNFVPKVSIIQYWSIGIDSDNGLDIFLSTKMYKLLDSDGPQSKNILCLQQLKPFQIE